MHAAASNPIVSVVIPAYNAQATLAETLDSALGQTCREIEVIVVDDGSGDATFDIAEAHARRDARLRVLQQPNGGVSRARNLAIQHARGRFIAPLDADDLWHPSKLELQLRALERVPGAALAYNWSRYIDEHSTTYGSGAARSVEGRVLHRHIMWNFINNGSTPLVVADVLRRVGYEPEVQGSEDYLMQLLVAKDHQFACVPAYLTGYRRVSGTMSSNVLQRVRAMNRTFAMFSSKVEGPARALCLAREAQFLGWEADLRLRRGALADAGALLASALRRDLPAGVRSILKAPLHPWLAYLNEPRTKLRPAPFSEQDPWALDLGRPPSGYARCETRLAEADKLPPVDLAAVRAAAYDGTIHK